MKKENTNLVHKITGAGYGAGQTIERVIFPGGATIERRCNVGGRGMSSYYDRHRTAMGETGETTSDVITLHGADAARFAAALGVPADHPHLTERLFEAAKEAARGTGCTPPRVIAW